MKQNKKDVRLFKMGDPDYWRELYLSLNAMMCAKIASIGVPYWEIEDVANEAWISAWAHRGQFRGDSLISSWTYTITINAALMHLRAMQRRDLPVGVEACEADEIPDPRSIEDQMDAKTALKAINVKLRTLRPDFRAIYLLRQCLEWGNPETAKKYNITIPAEKSRFHRSRLKLARVIEEQRKAVGL